MANMTLAIPEALHKEILAHPEIKWSEVARQAFNRKVAELHWIDIILSKSDLNEKEAEEIGHKIKKEIAKRFSK